MYSTIFSQTFETNSAAVTIYILYTVCGVMKVLFHVCTTFYLPSGEDVYITHLYAQLSFIKIQYTG